MDKNVIIGAVGLAVLFGVGFYAKAEDMSDFERNCRINDFSAARCSCAKDVLSDKLSIINYVPIIKSFTRPDESQASQMLQDAVLVCRNYK